MSRRTTIYVLIGAVITVNISAHITRLAPRLPLEGPDSPPGAPWPMPQIWQTTDRQKTLNPFSLQFSSNMDDCDVMKNATERYRGLLLLHPNATEDGGLSRLQRLAITVTDVRCGSDHFPTFDSQQDEMYELEVSGSNDATLRAQTIWAVLRGLETFSQLVHLSDDLTYRINETRIQDYPRFLHRGLLLDTARHFIPRPIIIKFLETMAWNKLNVFHWHIVDDQSFPYPSRTYPNLTEYGSYTPAHQYSREDINLTLHEARLRGIKVIPEFDTPGHTWSWGKALPHLLTPCWGNGTSGGPHVANYTTHSASEVLNPMENYTYEVLEELYREVVEDFPSGQVHLGLDEIRYGCWQSNPNITEWMDKMNFTDFPQVEEYFANRLIDIVDKLGVEHIAWEDPIHNNATLANNTVIQLWKETENGLPGEFDSWENYTRRVAEHGYKMILSSPWYLNIISYGQDWRKYYMVEPTNFTDDPWMKSLIIGGEATVWTEYIDGSNIMSRVWPRGSAVAERLWSAENVTDVEEAKYRLDQQRCRMVRRGVAAQPILNGYCGDYDIGFEDTRLPCLSDGQHVIASGLSIVVSLITTVRLLSA